MNQAINELKYLKDQMTNDLADIEKKMSPNPWEGGKMDHFFNGEKHVLSYYKRRLEVILKYLGEK
jgi:hypothetical protein